jgi:eukaryotic-like serine/threonine-protein kinase
MGDPATTCPECGAAIDAAQSGGLCVACLLGEAMDAPEQGGTLGRIGGHELIEVIARGGMGIVYRARQSDPEREMALKALPGADLRSEEARQRFKIEAQAMARLDHPHILPVHEIGEQDGTPFYTMKLATGGTLAQRVGDYAEKWREIADTIATLAEAVQFAHSRGVLHRDLKPGNVLFDENGIMYVSDFGLAKLIGTDTDLTRTIAMMGTPTYLAPELVGGGKHGVSTASDVWSLGVMLYELIAGHPPFQAENVAALLRQIAEEKPPPLVGRLCETAQERRLTQTPHNEDRRLTQTPHNEKRRLTQTPYNIPRDLAVITFKALAKDPARRYTTAQALADDLRRWLAGEPIHARPVSLAERGWLWCKRKPALAAVLALLALTLAGSAALLLRSNDILRARDAELRAVDAQRRGQIHRALLEKADAERQSMTPGRRERALALVREALTHGTSTQARSVAASTLAVQDVRVTQTWPIGRLNEGSSPMAFTPDLAHHVAIVPAAQVRDPAWKEGALGLWRTADQALLKQIPITQRANLGFPILSADARWVCMSVNQRQLEIWDLQAEQRLASLPANPPNAAFHPTDGTLITVLGGELLRLHLPDLRRESLASGLTNPPIQSISPDGTLIAFSQNRDLDGITPIFRLEVRSLVDGARVYTAPIYVWGTLAWAPDSRALAVFDRNTNALSLHDIHAAGKVLPRELVRSANTGRRVAIWPDGRTLGWVDNTGFLRLLDLWSGGEVLRLPAEAMSLAVSTDGTHFTFTPDSATAALGEILSAPILQQRKSTLAERSVDRELACSPDGRWLATAHHHQGITLWQAEPLRPVAHRLTHAPYQNTENLHFSADSRQLRFNSGTTRRTVCDIVEGKDGAVTLTGADATGPKSEHVLTAASLNGRWECTVRPDQSTAHHHLWRDGEIVSKLKRDYNPHRVDWHSRLLSPDGRWVAYGCMTEESAAKPGFTYITYFDRDKHRIMLSWQASHTYLAIAPDSRWLLGG